MAEFDAGALAYDRFRPRYPAELFDDLVNLGELRRGTQVVEVGAGTGIATRALVDRGLAVTALEPAPNMAAIAVATLGPGAHVEVTSFEDWNPSGSFQMVVAFNAWHWVHPQGGIEKAIQALEADGSVAIVWTEVVSWGEDPFESRLADVLKTSLAEEYRGGCQLGAAH